jgi:hypothetical protein
MNRDPLEYVLNRMEAEREKPTPHLGYASVRQELLDAIATLRAENLEFKKLLDAPEKRCAAGLLVLRARNAELLAEKKTFLEGAKEMMSRIALLEELAQQVKAIDAVVCQNDDGMIVIPFIPTWYRIRCELICVNEQTELRCRTGEGKC